MKVLYKRRWTAATAFAVVFITVVVYTFTVTPIFEAKARLLIESDTPNVVSFKEVIDEQGAKADYYQTQYNIVQSRALARKTLDSLSLWETSPFGGNAHGNFTVKKVIGSSAAALIGMVKSSGDAIVDKDLKEEADETAAQSRAIDIFLGGLTVSPIRNSRLVDVRYRSSDPDVAQKIVNALTKNYIEQNLEYKFLASKEASDWLGERLAEHRRQVEVAEARLQQYREQNDAIALDDRQDIVVQKLADLNGAVTRAKTERIEKEALYRQIEGIQAERSGLDTFPAVLSNTFIQQQKTELAGLQRQLGEMGERLGDKHPNIMKLRSSIQSTESKLQAEIAKVVQSVHNEFRAAQAQEQSLVVALNQQKGEALAMNRKGIEYGVLQRDAESSRQIYDSLLRRAKETGVSEELKTSNIRVVDAAERPRSPVTPQKRLNMLIALLGGSFFAGALAFFFEYMDNRIKTPDEIRAHLGLPYLGLLPAVTILENEPHYPLLSNRVPPHFSEAFRSIRTNVLFSSAHEGSRSVVVTSTGPGEGKSMVSANLAISLAQAGQRVLLIDADMRKPKVHDMFAMDQEPGLSNLLVGNAKATDAVRKSGVQGLWLLTAGRTPPNPAELVGSQRCREFIASLKDHFEWVIIDSPPVMAVTDAALIAHYASEVLFVVGAEMTNRHAAVSALDHLEQVQARFVGVVLNRVDLHRNAYYYSQYYTKEYTRYYTSA